MREKTMKQNKKESWFKENAEWLIAIVIIFALFALIGIAKQNYFFSDKYFCSQNPDKCVCVSEVVGYCDEKCSEVNFCREYRKKTQAELDIGDCNNNPREDEKCMCEDFEENQYLKCSTTISCIGLINEKNRNKWNTEETIVYLTTLGLSKPLEFFSDCTNAVVNKPIPITMDMCKYINKSQCIKSHPKTECEKENYNYIEELVDYEIIDTSTTPHKECILLDGDCVAAIKNCRQKTEVEKKDCDWIFNTMRTTITIDYLEELKQAWRQKGCSI